MHCYSCIVRGGWFIEWTDVRVTENVTLKGTLDRSYNGRLNLAYRQLDTHLLEYVEVDQILYWIIRLSAISQIQSIIDLSHDLHLKWYGVKSTT
jgi:hypothetical protein